MEALINCEYELNAGGAPEFSDQSGDSSGEPGRFRFVDDVGLEHLPDPEWLIEGVLPKAAIGVLYGLPATYKSFIATDWALCVATGTAWAGRKVQRGPAIYVAAEGVNGYKARVRSWKEDRDFVGRAGVHFLTEAVQLHASKDVEEFVASVEREEIAPSLIVFDTLSRCFVGGDENSAGAMSKVIEAVEQIRRSTGASVLLVHHANKSGDSERGSIALRGGVDVMVVATRTGKGGRVKLACVKMKDAPEFNEIHFQFVERGQSGVLALADASSSRSKDSIKLSARQQAQLNALPPSGATYTEWKKLAVAAGVPEGSFAKNLRVLVNAGLVVHDGRVYRPSEKDAPGSIESIPPRSGDTKILTVAPLPGTPDNDTPF